MLIGRVVGFALLLLDVSVFAILKCGAARFKRHAE